eukprot:s3076_g15.t1
MECWNAEIIGSMPLPESSFSMEFKMSAPRSSLVERYKALGSFGHPQDNVLRFKAKFLNPKPQDANRIFLISYYLQDHTFAIYELLPSIARVFLERGIHLNQITGLPFCEANDVIPGNAIKIYNNEFLIMDYAAKKDQERCDSMMDGGRADAQTKRSSSIFVTGQMADD